MPTIKKSVSRKWQPKREAFGRRQESGFDYNATWWRKDRKAHLTANPLCVHCLAKGVYTSATVSDHIRPISQGGDAHSWDNRQALCATCHNIKSGTEARTKWK